MYSPMQNAQTRGVCVCVFVRGVRLYDRKNQ
jgi:hypothetical protein